MSGLPRWRPEVINRLPRWLSEIISIVLWWGTLALALWLLSQGLNRPPSLVACIASGALLAAVGETGDWLRRRRRTRRDRSEVRQGWTSHSE
ncbi:hypothetical protein ACWEQU_15075 [Streptomyces nodosus]